MSGFELLEWFEPVTSGAARALAMGETMTGKPRNLDGKWGPDSRLPNDLVT